MNLGLRGQGDELIICHMDTTEFVACIRTCSSKAWSVCGCAMYTIAI
jgi:hypothetical protein